MYEKYGRSTIMSYHELPTLGRFAERRATIQVTGNRKCLSISIQEKTDAESFGATFADARARYFYNNIKAMYEQMRDIMESENPEDK